MSFGDGSAASALPAFKKFESAEEIEEKRRKRQEEWEKVRTPDQPEEAPEEEYDPRSLYEKLQEQKDKKQAEYEDQFKLSDQVKGLDEGEAEFLDLVSERQMKLDKMRQEENEGVLKEYRDAMANQVVPVDETKPETQKPSKQPAAATATSSKKSQQALLKGVIKRKSTDSQKTDDAKKSKTEETEADTGQSKSTGDVQIGLLGEIKGQTGQVVGILPGIADYSDSDDESTSSSDSDTVNTDIFKKSVRCHVQAPH